MTKVAVVGAGPGGQTAAAHLATCGCDVTLADVPEFADRLARVRTHGGVTLDTGWRGREVVPVEVAESMADAVSEAEVVVLSVRAVAHERFVGEIAPALRRDAMLLFFGEGGGALVAWRALSSSGRSDVLVGETNCLPFIARCSDGGAVQVVRKVGGVLAAAIPASRSDEAAGFLRNAWPFIETGQSVWTTTLVNFDAIDVVPVALMNAGTLEGRPGGMLLWGEGATPSIVRVIESVDRELLSLREALGATDHRTYRDFLVAQGLAPDVGSDLYTVMRAGGIVRSVRASGDREALSACLALEVPYTLVLASSLGAAVGLDTPVIDALIALAAIVLGRDVRAEGRTLERLGLSRLGREGLSSYALTGVNPAPGADVRSG